MFITMARPRKETWIIISIITLYVFIEEVHTMNGYCITDEELNHKITTYTKIYTEALKREIQEEMNQICSTNHEGSLVPVVQDRRLNVHVIQNPTSQPSLEACIAHCGLADEFLFYYDNDMMCSCNPKVTPRLYMDIFSSTEINRFYTHPDDFYISCEDLSSGVEQSTASVWTNTQPYKRYNDYSRDPLIAHILPCDMSGGGWTVIQRRVDGAVDFNRSYLDYVNGFGNAGGNFWLGLETIYQLTSDGPVQLRITLETWEDTEDAVIFYSSFQLENGRDKYRLRVSGYSQPATVDRHIADGLGYGNDNAQFSTYDQDNDGEDAKHCALTYGGGWWFGGNCPTTHLNGIYYNIPQAAYGQGVQWFPYRRGSYSFKGTSMSIL